MAPLPHVDPTRLLNVHNSPIMSFMATERPNEGLKRKRACRLPQVDKTPRPVTVERIERGLDTLALAIERAGKKGRLYLPIFERLESERDRLLAENDIMARVQERLRRSSDRTSA